MVDDSARRPQREEPPCGGGSDGVVEPSIPRHTTAIRRPSSNGWAQRREPTTGGGGGPSSVVIQVVATGSGRWSDEAGSTGSEPVDCAVSVEVQAPTVKGHHPPLPPAPQQPPGGRASSGRRWARRGLLALLVLGLVTAAIVVPTSQVWGFHRQLPPSSRSLPPAAPSYRAIFAFDGASPRRVAADALPAAAAAGVTRWAVLASSGVHVAEFESHEALQLGIAALANATGLRYALSDFALQPDRRMGSVVTPEQLFELSRQTNRQLLSVGEQQPDEHSMQPPSSPQAAGATSAAAPPAASRLMATHKQRLAARKAKRQRQLWLLQQRPLASIRGLPDTARASERQWPAATAAAAAAAATSALPPGSWTPAAGGGQQLLAPVAEAADSGGRDGPASPPHAVRAADLGSTSRRLHQEPPAPPEPQPQQRQALQHIQRGGSGIAWHLGGAGLRTREAWNTTYGRDDLVVAVVDSGVELSHGGVGAAVWANSGEVAGDGLDNDGNGFVDDAMGWDFAGACADAACSRCVPGADPSDVAGWGTHAAAIIAAQPEVAAGTSGLAPGVRVMALKVAGCAAGTQLGDQAARRLAEGRSSGGAPAGPQLLGSAAVQALDYALLNGAHIVLAAWSAGAVIDTSGVAATAAAAAVSNTSSSIGGGGGGGGGGGDGMQAATPSPAAMLQCVLGVRQAAVEAAAAGGAAGVDCVASAQRLLFEDVLRPLDEAGLLVITSQPGSGASSIGTGAGAGASSAPLPCALGRDLAGVLCVGPAPPAPDGADERPLDDRVAAVTYFEPLIYSMTGAADTGASNSSGTAAAGAAAGAALPPAPARQPSDGASAAGGAGGVGGWAQLQAPGTNILGGWAWGSHAAVSGSSAAAAVTAGAAALTWSALAQTLGAEASLGAFEGLGRLVRRMLLEGGSSGDGGGIGGSSRRSAVASRPGGGSEGGTDAYRAESGAAGGGWVAAIGLDLTRAVGMARAYTGPLQLRPSFISPSVTALTPTLGYSWYISSPSSGPFDTQAMTFVARKAVAPASFPLRDWEFFGDGAMVEVLGFLDVHEPGNYTLGVSSADRFVLALQDKWVAMAAADGATAAGLSAPAWTAAVGFTQPGNYKIRILIYEPELSAFDLQWRRPGAASFTRIPRFASLGRGQPLPQALMEQATGHMRAAEVPAAVLAAVAPPPMPPQPLAAVEAPAAAAPAEPPSRVPTTEPPQPPPAVLTTFVAAQAHPQPLQVQQEQQEQQDQPPDGSADSGSLQPVGSLAGGSGAGDTPSYGTPSVGSAVNPFAGFFGGGGGWGFPGFGGSGYSRAAEPPAAAAYDTGYGYGGTGYGGGGSSSPGPSGFLSFFDLLFGGFGRGHERAAAATAGRPAGAASATRRRLQDAAAGTAEEQQQWRQGAPANVADGASPLPGVFTVAMALLEPTSYRTVVPSLRGLHFTHTGVLPGPGLHVPNGWALQQQLLGFADATDDRAGYGVIQGWVDWAALNPGAAAWLDQQQQGGGGGAAGAPAAPGNATAPTAGVQFEVTCASGSTQMGCSLHADGAVVAGALDEAERSSCVVPARHLPAGSAAVGGDEPPAGGARLLHLELAFATNDVRAAQLEVRARPCVVGPDGAVAPAPGSSGAFAPLAAAPGASALGASAAAVATLAGAPGGMAPGMLCSMRAALPPHAVVGGVASNSSGGADSARAAVLRRLVFLDASQMSRAALASAASAAAPSGPSNHSASEDFDPRAEATSRAVAGAVGVSVQQLAPDWAASLPADTVFGFTCASYWNGSWAGNMSAGVHAGGAGSAALYLSGWPVAAQPVLPLYGPSDIAVADYSTRAQRHQLASGSSSADPLRWAEGAGAGRLAAATSPEAAAEWGFRPLTVASGDVFPLGELDAAAAFSVPSLAGWHQLLVIQGEGLAASGSVVVVAAAGSGSDADGPSMRGWMPGPRDAWAPLVGGGLG